MLQVLTQVRSVFHMLISAITISTARNPLSFNDVVIALSIAKQSNRHVHVLYGIITIQRLLFCLPNRLEPLIILFVFVFKSEISGVLRKNEFLALCQTTNV